MSFSFQAEHSPFPRWWGPFSPSRGIYSGFRFHNRQMGTWVENAEGKEFWPLEESPGLRAVTRLILGQWHGGRVLLLLNGLVIKPLQGDYEVGRRVLVGRFQGPVVLVRPSGGVFNLERTGKLNPGDPWPGPKTTGLECTIQPAGSLWCNWYHPTSIGRDEVREQVWGPDPQLAKGFRKARPQDSGGRVRVTANGHVITNCQGPDGEWHTFYIGRIAAQSWPHRQDWIGKERL